MMRYDPADLADLRFIIAAGNLSAEMLRPEMAAARIPDIPEIREQFALCQAWLESYLLELPPTLSNHPDGGSHEHHRP